ncbi:unnamed protein product [Darwinula stevensoni]|uniref:Rhodanese domain-containing protein n=1 Tax=Darwinula stevensoni TaxID=69355 RepID=A0A7R9A7R0_9CRUS|nr:unnamed protein product [Darwinula stevensoni]CAG0894557.1 unnamed protein product [Darwinula stevensoni]
MAEAIQGFNARKLKEAELEKAKYYKFRLNEVFKRVSVDAMVALIAEVAVYDRMKAEKEEMERKQTAETSTKELLTLSHAPEGPGNTLANLMRGTGGIDERRWKKEQAMKDEAWSNRPYLLLDVRSEDLYREQHIKTALNFPLIRLSRSITWETQEMTSFIQKNKGEKIIVVYDEDETLSHRVATTFVQRGYENIFILSGGLALMRDRYKRCGILTSPEKGSTFTEEQIQAMKKRLDKFDFASVLTKCMGAIEKQQPVRRCRSEHSLKSSRSNFHLN